MSNSTITGPLPPNCPEAEKGILGCCLLDLSKANRAIQAGVNRRWFYDLRHAELFNVLSGMALNGAGDALVATILLRERGLLENIGGVAYLLELENSVPSPENFDYYLPKLRENFERRLVVDAATRLKLIAEDPTNNAAGALADLKNFIETVQRPLDANALPEIVSAVDFLASDLPIPPLVIAKLLHQGSKLIIGGSSKKQTLTDSRMSAWPSPRFGTAAFTGWNSSPSRLIARRNGNTGGVTSTNSSPRPNSLPIWEQIAP